MAPCYFRDGGQSSPRASWASGGLVPLAILATSLTLHAPITLPLTAWPLHTLFHGSNALFHSINSLSSFRSQLRVINSGAASWPSNAMFTPALWPGLYSSSPSCSFPLFGVALLKICVARDIGSSRRAETMPGSARPCDLEPSSVPGT